MVRCGVITNQGNPRSAHKRIRDRLIETGQITEKDGLVRRITSVAGCVPSAPLRDGGTAATPKSLMMIWDATGRWDAGQPLSSMKSLGEERDVILPAYGVATVKVLHSLLTRRVHSRLLGGASIPVPVEAS
jgi:hypothetical protein